MPRLYGNGVPLVPTGNSVLFRECVSLIADDLSDCGISDLEQGLRVDDFLNTLLLAIRVGLGIAINYVLQDLIGFIEEGSWPDLQNWSCELSVESRVDIKLK